MNNSSLFMKQLQFSFATVAVLVSIFLSACQKHEPENKTTVPNKPTVADKQERATDIPAFPQDCASIDTAIQNLKSNYAPESLDILNQLFKTCTASVPLETRYQWMQSANQIYKTQIEKLPKKVTAYITQLSEKGLTLSETDLKKLKQQMNPQEKYAVDHQKSLFLSQYNLGEGEYLVSRAPNYELEIFAPSLPEADQVYLKETAKQEHEIDGSLSKDAGLTVSFSQLADWLIFWESYIKQYPNAHFTANVQTTINEYQRSLFLGDDNTPVFEITDLTVGLDPDALKAINTLAKTNSISAKKAQKFLTYFNDFQKSGASFNEKTSDQIEYNLFVEKTRQSVQNFKNNYWKDLNKLLNLEHP